MRHLYLRSSSLKRLLPIGHRSKAGESSEKTPSSRPASDFAERSPPEPEDPNKPTWRCFSYEEIHQATNGFHQDNLVGRGGYSEVYSGVLPEAGGVAIAVKRLAGASSVERKEKAFLTELGTAGHAHHPNVCALLGCCVDRDLFLVFELASRGSVFSSLHGDSSPPMTWKLRYNIALGTARGLHYLHKECRRRIIHRDIKASNILLTDSFEPKISDFGLAKWLPKEWSHHAIAPIEGTFGCLAPEYFTHGIVDEKTDVFAFGIFLLELITGRKPVDGTHKSLLGWAKPYLKDGAIQALVDPLIGGDYNVGQMKTLVFAASLCIRAPATWRPSMAEVLELLDHGESTSPEWWKMPEGEEDGGEIWDFDDLEDKDECDTPSSSSSNKSD